MAMRANIVDRTNLHSCCEKMTQLPGSFLKKAYTVAEKLATAAVVLLIAGCLIFSLFLGLLQFAFIIFC